MLVVVQIVVALVVVQLVGVDLQLVEVLGFVQLVEMLVDFLLAEVMVVVQLVVMVGRVLVVTLLKYENNRACINSTYRYALNDIDRKLHSSVSSLETPPTTF